MVKFLRKRILEYDVGVYRRWNRNSLPKEHPFWIFNHQRLGWFRNMMKRYGFDLIVSKFVRTNECKITHWLFELEEVVREHVRYKMFLFDYYVSNINYICILALITSILQLHAKLSVWNEVFGTYMRFLLHCHTLRSKLINILLDKKSCFNCL